MSQRSFCRAKARRALSAESLEDSLAANRSTIDEDLSIKGLVTHGLAALAISALGLAVAGSVALTASAQSLETSTSTSASTGADTTQAKPAAVQQPQNQPAAVNDGKDTPQNETIDGALDVFARQADGTSRNAVRAAIDGAVADQIAKERGAQLVATGEQATETSGAAIADARSTNLVNKAQAAKREQARLAQEKRKSDEALKKAGGQPTGTLEASGPQIPGPAPQVGTGEISGSGGAKPIASGYTVGSRWGAVGAWRRYHTGQDLPAPIGTPIRAAAAGVVMGPAAGAGWAGTHVVIKHADGSSTLYAHMSTSLARPGQMVAAGQQIGAVGMTGRTFGPHLHFEHYPAGTRPGDVYKTDDPYSWMLRMGVRL